MGRSLLMVLEPPYQCRLQLGDVRMRHLVFALTLVIAATSVHGWGAMFNRWGGEPMARAGRGKRTFDVRTKITPYIGHFRYTAALFWPV